MLCMTRLLTSYENILRQYIGYVHFLRKMSVNGAIEKISEACKRELEEQPEEPSKKLCTEENSVEAPKKSKRHKYAMLLGYNGNKYYGMQHNGNISTIESELFKAFAKVGIMKESEVKEPYLIRFQRAARTDRAVSAAGQVVSLTMTDDLAKPEDINIHLPPDIRIFSIKRVTKGFDSKGNCDARTYSYILPTHILSQEPLETFLETDYRITPDVISKANEILKIFVGTHNFHNFTSKRHFDDPSAKRFIMSFSCGEPFIHEKEFITFTVKGQSFILHQVRKMVGTAIGVIRGIVPPETIHTTFFSEKLRIPLAPGEGLFLERPHFEKYNRRYGKDGFHETLTWEEVEEEMAEFRRERIVRPIVEAELTNKTIINWLADTLLASNRYFKPCGEDNKKSTENADNGVQEEDEEDKKETVSH